MTYRAFHLSGVFFHLEGTLVPSEMRRLKKALDCPAAVPLLDFILNMPDHARRRRALGDLSRLEHEAAAGWTAPDGAQPILSMLRTEGLRLGIFSRYGKKAVMHALHHVLQVPRKNGDLVMSRDELLTIGKKRNPFRMAAKIIRCEAKRLMVISADTDVLRSAKDAGAVTVHLIETAAPDETPGAFDFRVRDLRQIPRIIRMGIPLFAGKLPNELLKEFLAEFAFEDPSLIINPGVGEDIAAVDVQDQEVLVLKSDPITFATDAIGHYAVLVNANDIATAGAVPRWLLATLLFPPASTPSLIRRVLHETTEFCRQWGITLCGGHTEITDAVTRPVVSGMMAGCVRRRDLIDKRNMRPGDRVLLTKGAAVEGTAIIAREFEPRLRALGMSVQEVLACRKFLDRISVIPEARLAAACPGTSAMHDVTEGGVATALEELSAAGGCRLRVDLGRIPVFAETRAITRLLGIHPLGLIGSGSLLICCRSRYAARLESEMARSGIAVTQIGEIVCRGTGIEAVRGRRPARWLSFEVDEITRLFRRNSGSLPAGAGGPGTPCYLRVSPL